MLYFAFIFESGDGTRRSFLTLGEHLASIWKKSNYVMFVNKPYNTNKPVANHITAL